jgi:hypothetical protein
MTFDATSGGGVGTRLSEAGQRSAGRIAGGHLDAACQLCPTRGVTRARSIPARCVSFIQKRQSRWLMIESQSNHAAHLSAPRAFDGCA